jgi:type VI secretion system secreted protein VgrG
MQQGRLEVRIESADFPCDRLEVRELHGREQISRLFEIELLAFVPATEPLSSRSVAGARATIVFLQDGAEVRRMHGMIAEVTDLFDTEPETLSYRMRFVPRAWRSSLIRTQEIYMDRSLREIIEQKLDLIGLEGASAFLLHGKDDRREFVVQYDETDLAFISRLAEHVGWSFHFDHSGDEGDRIVFSDHQDGFRATPGAESASFRPRGEHTGVYRMEASTRLVPAMFAVGDFNYQAPQVDLYSVCEVQGGYGGGVVEYHTHHKTSEEGAVLARVRAEESQAGAIVIRGEAALPTLAAGARITISGHPILDSIELLLVRVEHHGRFLAYGSDKGGDESYRAVFEAIAADVPYRPPRVTPKPKIVGVVSGIIEADPGVSTQRAWIDEHGRYLVRMLFDTAAPGERKASLPIRMAQAHSGPGYGVHFPLRPGAEVLIAFVGGDPDRPVIVGSVPNALTPTPVVDKDATQHRIRTWSGVLVEIDDGS